MFSNKKEVPADRRANEAERIRREIAGVVREGKLPEGFDLTGALHDEKFISLLLELPAYAAIRVYAAEQETVRATEQAIERLMQRRREQETLPQPTRAAGNTAPVIDYMAMSPEAFSALEKRLKAASRNGRRVAL